MQKKNINMHNKYINTINNYIKKYKNRISEIDNLIELLDTTKVNQKIQLQQINSEKNLLVDKIKDCNWLIKTYHELIVILNKWLNLDDEKLSEMQSQTWYRLWSNNVCLNSSYWHEILWIENNSVDIIFMNHVITKSTVDTLQVLKQADSLLKKWWKYILWKMILFIYQKMNIFQIMT